MLWNVKAFGRFTHHTTNFHACKLRNISATDSRTSKQNTKIRNLTLEGTNPSGQTVKKKNNKKNRKTAF